MSAAAPPALPRTPSDARHQHAYAPSPSSPRTAAPASPRRSLSSPQNNAGSHSRTSSGQAQLVNVARRDNEQLDLSRQASTRRSDSKDRHDSTPSRNHSTREPHSSASRQSRQNSEAPTTNGSSTLASSRHGSTTNARRRTTIECTTGVWELGKTIGAGSMGKVKLARNRETHEQVRQSRSSNTMRA